MKASAVFFTLLLGASASNAAAAPAEALTIYHRWASASESAAFQGLVDLFKAKYPEVAVKPVLIPRRSGSMYIALKVAVQAGATPDAVHIHVGQSVRPFFDAKMLSAVDDIWAAEKLEPVVPVALQWMRQSDDRYYSIPINVHRTNLVWYNKSLLDKHRIDPAALTTWAKLFEAAGALRAAGVVSPIQIGEAWTLAHLFECIVASLGLSTYEDWVKGQVRDAADPRMSEALGVLKQYLGYVNKDYDGLEWDAALARVIKGESAFCAMGDWSDGEFRQAGLRYGTDYGALPVPGTKKMYGASIDAFHRIQRAGPSTNADRWLKLVASREGQDVFNRIKGSIPARTDADVSKYGAYQRLAIADFKTAKAYPTFGTATPEAYQQNLNRTLLAFTKDLDVKKAAAALAAAAASLAETPARSSPE